MSRISRVLLDAISEAALLTGEGVPTLAAPTGSVYARRDGVAGDTMYQRTTTGWERLGAAGSAITGSLTNGMIPVATGVSSLGNSQLTQYAGPDQIRSAVAFHPATDGLALGESSTPRRWAISATTISASGTITAPTFSGALSGNAATATALQTSRTIWGQGFTGAADVSGAMSGVTTLAMGGALTGATTGAFSTSVTTPLVTNAGTLSLSATGANIVQVSTNGSVRLSIASNGEVQSNGWTKVYAAVGGSGVFNMRGSDSTADAREWSFRINAGVLELRSTLDNNTTSTHVFSVARAGGVTFHVGGIAVTGNSTITGTLGGITTLTASGLISSTAAGNAFGATNAASYANIGGTASSNVKLYLRGTDGSSTTGYGIYITQTVGSTSTVGYYGLRIGTTTTDAVYTTTTVAGVFIDNIIKGASHTITNAYGIYITHPSVGGTNWSIYTTGQVRFGGNVTVSTGGISVTGNSTITGTLGGITTLTATTFVGALTGNASTATELSSSRTFALTGDATGSVSSTLSAGMSIATTLANSGVTAASYGSASAVGTFTVDAKGRITAAANASISIAASQVSSGVLPVARGGTNLGSYTAGSYFYASTTGIMAQRTPAEVLTDIGAAPLVHSHTLGVDVSIAGFTTLAAYGITDGVVGPASATDNAVMRYNATTGKLAQNSVVLIGDTGAVTGVTDLTASASVRVGGYSTSYGVTTSAGTVGTSVSMGVAAGATWLMAGLSGGVFRYGIQGLDVGGVLRLYLASNYAAFTTGSGTTVDVSNLGTVTATTFSGSGASLTALNADNISTGTLGHGRLLTTGTGPHVIASNGRLADASDLNLRLESAIHGTHATVTNGPAANSYDTLLVLRNSDVGAQLHIPRDNARQVGVRGWSSSGASFTAWRYLVDTVNAQTIAGVKTFSSTIVGSVSGSATTLTTTRTIFGQNFNGSANVSGAMSGVTTLAMGGALTGATTGAFSTSVTTPLVIGTTTSTRDKLRVWDSSTYTIGMQTGFTFGGLVSDYAMTFQMSATTTRGWWWGHSGHTAAQGAMAVTTEGRLTVAHSMRLGYGTGDTTVPGASYALDVSGTVRATSHIETAGSLYATGDLYAYNSTALAFRRIASSGSSYNYLYREDGGVGIYLGGVDPANYYDNGTHFFRSAGGVLHTTISASGVTAYDWILSSDLRAKRDVTEVRGALGIVRAVPGIHYWHVEKERWELGFGAQHLLVTPIGVLTTTQDDSGRYGVLYSRTIPVLWQAVREQDSEVLLLKRKVKALEDAVRALGGTVEMVA